MNDKDFKLINYINPVPRKLMSKKEIEWAEKQVKKGNMRKGTSDDKQKSVIFYTIKQD